MFVIDRLGTISIKFLYLGGFVEFIMFLDVDGVLNNNIFDLSLESINVLKQILQIYNTKVVMITSIQSNETEYRI